MFVHFLLKVILKEATPDDQIVDMNQSFAIVFIRMRTCIVNLNSFRERIDEKKVEKEEGFL